MGGDREYSIAERYIPAVINVLKQTGHLFEKCGNDITILSGNVMKGFIDSSGNVRISTDNTNILSELERYQNANTDYGE